ncbi:MAG: hypothetical protein AAGC67_10825 [Myxococcota bacterium]
MPASLFLLIALALLAAVPLAAAGLRRALPAERGATVPVDEVEFGVSQKARRSPRHAVLLHRGLLGAFFMALVALALVPAAVALRSLGIGVFQTALWLVLPTLLVVVHAGRGGRPE